MECDWQRSKKIAEGVKEKLKRKRDWTKEKNLQKKKEETIQQDLDDMVAFGNLFNMDQIF